MADEGFKRKLTTIFSADAAGYSRLMGKDEAATVKTITAYRTIMSDLITRHRGRVIDSPGDNLLAEFGSVVDAVQCAVAVQKELQARNVELPEDRKMKFRIGINLGDVIQEGDRIYGDGVNIAARLEGLAESGGICISKTTFDQIENKLPYGYEYLGNQTVKNIDKPVGAYRVSIEPRVTTTEESSARPKARQARTLKIAIVCASALLIAIGVVAMWQSTFQKIQSPDDGVDLRRATFPFANKPSIAVLPFENMTGDPQQQYFCDGMAEQLITSLSQGPYIYVTARTSSFAYRDKSMPAQQIANELGVRYLMEGSVQRDAERVRIHVQLIDGRNGNHIWAERYDRKYEDLFALQDQITMAVMSFLNVKITGYKLGAITVWRPTNLRAYEIYLKGLYYHLGRSPQDVRPARQAFEEAINLDPKFVMAYVWLGHVHLDEFMYRMTKSPEEVLERAEQLGQKALSLQGENQRYGYGLLSAVSRLRKDFDNAILYGKKCVESEPNAPSTHFMLAQALTHAEHFEEAISSMEIALQLAPFRPTNYLLVLALASVGNKQYGKAIPLFSEIIEREQNKFMLLWAYKGLAASYELSGNHDKARWAAENVMRINPKYSVAADEKKSPGKGNFKKTMFDAYRRAGLK